MKFFLFVISSLYNFVMCNFILALHKITWHSMQYETTRKAVWNKWTFNSCSKRSMTYLLVHPAIIGAPPSGHQLQQGVAHEGCILGLARHVSRGVLPHRLGPLQGGQHVDVVLVWLQGAITRHAVSGHWWQSGKCHSHITCTPLNKSVEKFTLYGSILKIEFFIRCVLLCFFTFLNEEWNPGFQSITNKFKITYVRVSHD